MITPVLTSALIRIRVGHGYLSQAGASTRLGMTTSLKNNLCQLEDRLNSPIDECKVFRGISQSTTVVGVTPGLGLRLILLDLLFLVTGRSVAALPLPVLAKAVEGDGGGGLLVLLAPASMASGSGMVGSVGNPSYAIDFAVRVGRRAEFPSLSSDNSNDPSRQARVEPFSTGNFPFALEDNRRVDEDMSMFSFDDSLDRSAVEVDLRGDEREEGGGETDAERDEREGRGETVRNEMG